MALVRGVIASSISWSLIWKVSWRGSTSTAFRWFSVMASIVAIYVLAYRLFEYYSKLDIDIIDIGPSSIDGVPDYGLLEFKESIGCSVCSKYWLKL